MSMSNDGGRATYHSTGRLALSCAIAVTIGLGLVGCAGGPTPVETAALAAAPVPAGKARVMIERPSSMLYSGAPATIELNGEKVASVWPGSSAVFDVPVGANKIAASAWSYPGTWTHPLEAHAGQTYKLIVEPRNASLGPGVFAPTARDRANANAHVNRPPNTNSGAIDAASNNNTIAFQMCVAQAGGV